MDSLSTDGGYAVGFFGLDVGCFDFFDCGFDGSEYEILMLMVQIPVVLQNRQGFLKERTALGLSLEVR